MQLGPRSSVFPTTEFGVTEYGMLVLDSTCMVSTVKSAKGNFCALLETNTCVLSNRILIF
jgi:hypothetical protein